MNYYIWRYQIMSIVSSYIVNGCVYVILCTCAFILHITDAQGSTTSNQFGCSTKMWSKQLFFHILSAICSI